MTQQPVMHALMWMACCTVRQPMSRLGLVYANNPSPNQASLPSFNSTDRGFNKPKST